VHHRRRNNHPPARIPDPALQSTSNQLASRRPIRVLRIQWPHTPPSQLDSPRIRMTRNHRRERATSTHLPTRPLIPLRSQSPRPRITRTQRRQRATSTHLLTSPLIPLGSQSLSPRTVSIHNRGKNISERFLRPSRVLHPPPNDLQVSRRLHRKLLQRLPQLPLARHLLLHRSRLNHRLRGLPL